MVSVLVLGGAVGAQTPDRLDVSDLQTTPPDCPDPAEMPGATAWSRPSPPRGGEERHHRPGGHLHLPLADFASLTLWTIPRAAGLSGVNVGDQVFRFYVEVEVGQPQKFILDLLGVVMDKTDTTLFFDITLQEVNDVTLAVLDYCDGACSPTDEQHSFGRVYEGSLVTRGPDKGFVFEYTLYEPDPSSASPYRGIEQGDLESPNYSIPVALTLVDGKKAVYTLPECGKVDVLTTLVPMIQSPTWLVEKPTEKEFPESFDLGACVVEPTFRRGDADTNGKVEITDAIAVLNFLFSGGATPTCMDAADADDNSTVEITDPILILGFLFLGSAEPAPPGTTDCGMDPSADTLAACDYKC